MHMWLVVMFAQGVLVAIEKDLSFKIKLYEY